MSAPTLINDNQFAERCSQDGEFGQAARFWNGGLRLEIGDSVHGITLTDGQATGTCPTVDAPGVVTLQGNLELWNKLLAANPPRFYNDLFPAFEQGLERICDRVTYAQYYPAVMRAIELLRPPLEPTEALMSESGSCPRFDAPVGRYVHLELAGIDYRIYFEEAGQGIPLLLQHTAGSHGTQWRHLFECPEITDRFRLIAYDLPFHGKSVPPVGSAWWTQTYALEGEFLRSIPVALAKALDVVDPVFMGCSVGGLLALDLAYHFPEVFHSVISLEGALYIGGELASVQEFNHPQVNGEYKARLMNGLTAPSSPTAYRKETTQTYAAGWPPVFVGDLNYYMQDYDLRTKAAQIDTSQVGVHIFSGEYDFSGTLEHGKAAHEAIAGSTWTPMPGVGHFPMSENPVRFIEYLKPILNTIADQGARKSPQGSADLVTGQI